ncbi:MAG: patatin-like phospholipase family protein [Pseudomonadota bacterium]
MEADLPYLRSTQMDAGDASTIELMQKAIEREPSLQSPGVRSQAEGSRILALSGGTEWGAYGAGYLSRLFGAHNRGVESSDQIDYRTYKVVTGVSTGALLAVYAFIGDSEGMRIYTRISQEDIIRRRGIGLLLQRGSGLTSTAPLKRLIRDEIDDEHLQKVLVERREGRSLLVGTVDMDSGSFHTFDLTALAEDALNAPDARDLYVRILLASAAVPLAMPAVWIGETPHIDGGVRNSIFAVDGSLAASRPNEQGPTNRSFNSLLIESLKRAQAREVPQPSPDSVRPSSDRQGGGIAGIDMIINGQIILDPQKREVISPLDAGLRALEILLAERAEDDRKAAQEVSDSLEARITTADVAVSEPDPCPIPDTFFNTAFMNCLFRKGQEQAGEWATPDSYLQDVMEVRRARK